MDSQSNLETRDPPSPMACPVCGEPMLVVANYHSWGGSMPTQKWYSHQKHDPGYCACVIAKRLDAKIDALIKMVKAPRPFLLLEDTHDPVDK